MRRFVGGIFCLLLAVGPSPAYAAERLRIVTYNVQNLAAPGTRASRLQRYRWDIARNAHLERVAATIEALEPDVINLLEVTSSEAIDELVRILHEKGLKQYVGHHVESNDRFTGFDVALITRIPPDEVDGKQIRTIFSPSGDPTWREKYSYEDDEGSLREREHSLDRNAVYYMTVAGHRLGFLGLHLKSNPDDAYSNSRRMAEVRIANRAVLREIVARGYTPIVLGDLNDYDPDVPDRDPERSTKTKALVSIKDYDPDSAGPELFNTAARIVRQADRYTSHWDRNENGARDPEDVFTMIDFVLVHKSLVPFIRRAFICRTGGLPTSDHWPVVVDLELPAKGSGAGVRTSAVPAGGVPTPDRGQPAEGAGPE